MSASVQEPRKDEWKAIANTYAGLTQRTTIPPTKALLEKANQRWPFSTATAILDNGSGPGPVTNMLFNTYGAEISPTATLHAADFSPAMIEQLKGSRQERIDAKDETSGLWQRLETSVLDAQVLEGVAENSLSHVISGMMYMLVPDPTKALRATHRVLVPNGVLSLSCWESSEWMDLMGTIGVQRSDGKDAPFLPPEWTNAEGVAGELQKAGFRNVEAERVLVDWVFEDAEALVDMLMTKIPAVIKRLEGLSSEEIQGKRQETLDQLRSKHPTMPGTMTGVALVAVGQK